MGASLRKLGLKIVAIANQKGGVGKTVTTLELASGLAREGLKVLAIDGDPQGNLSMFFHADSGKDFSDILKDLAEGKNVVMKDYLVKNVRKRLDLLPLHHRDLRRELHDVGIDGVSSAFWGILASHKNDYDWILIDSSPSNGSLERLLIKASEAVLVPLEFQLFSVSGLEAMLKDVARCSEEAGHDIRVHSLVFTKAENNLARVATYREIFSQFHIPIFEICKSEYIPKSLERSKTIWESGPSSFAARDYKKIITRVFLE